MPKLDEVTLVDEELESLVDLNLELRHQYFRRIGVHSSSSGSDGSAAMALECAAGAGRVDAAASSLHPPRLGTLMQDFAGVAPKGE